MSSIRGKFLVGSLVTALAVGMAFDAEAKRMGGSRSIGKQSESVTQRQQTQPTSPTQQAQQPAQQAAPATAGAAGAAAAAAPKRNWGGILGGIAAGLGIGWLLSHFGLGGAALSFLSNLILIAIVAFAVIWLIRKFRGGSQRSQQPAYAGAAGAGNAGGLGRSAEPMLRQPLNTPASNPVMPGAAAAPVAADAVAPQPWGVPADFDTDNFLRNAKVHFVRLQAAWDAGNLDDIREFTTPEMFAEIKMDLSERGAEVNKTDVVTLEGQLLGIESTPSQHIASVRFSGMIREKAGEAAQPFAEVWNLAKPATGTGGWLLAGIQQES
ncbi:MULTISPECIES: Tim44 domain-containing protein [Cupriavidus]|uniref:Tim44 domain-containing protein n=1 Tax=Cupriavidus oxalaticus TaxID=96344 RepID=A0A4P7L942_9BURK|nr:MULTISPECIES: Tim44-like domain-containing protein [Cupriavidus]MBF6990648.1 Tim44 domain-containing protein [Cupriavidus sp. IK-TO18]QBY52108.1 Tim44 domain-containing protein [Cupriavidus oxalaticus]TDF65938.1 Tim44 domain-containing protein [Cupriavidus sp. L7L]